MVYLCKGLPYLTNKWMASTYMNVGLWDNSPCGFYTSCITIISRMFTEETALELECLSGGGHICLLSKIINIMSPFGAKFKQVSLQPLLKDYGFLSSGFLNYDTDLLCMQHPPYLDTTSPLWGLWGRMHPGEHEGHAARCAGSNRFLCLYQGVICVLPDLWTCSRLACQLASRLKISDLSHFLICRKILKHNVLRILRQKKMYENVYNYFIYIKF